MADEKFVLFFRDGNGLLTGDSTIYLVHTDDVEEFYNELRNEYMGDEERFPTILTEDQIVSALDDTPQRYFEDR